MSAFLFPNNPPYLLRTLWHDDRVRSPEMQRNTKSLNSPQASPWADGMRWPSSRYACGDPSMDMWLVGNCSTDIARWGHPALFFAGHGGNQTVGKFRGTTRDSSGTALGNATVQVFRASDELYVGDCVSDAGGYFEAGSQYPGVGHYLVGYKPGSPDVAGTTVNTLQPDSI